MRGATITLTQQEEALCQLLDHTCDYIHVSRPHIPEVDSSQFNGDGSERCEARIAGGWVRDKLLARDSDDLDISLSTLTGNAFALYLKHYLSSPNFAASALASSPYFQNDKPDMGRIGKIAANPEQSKSLETATARVLGLSLDFVNLRKETYDPGSRIPTMQFGSPKEDAGRRDITINSLLFNVHTRHVEDHTGKGLTDLAAGLIRTPLPPLTTFLDDPLRVLRCIRFASRFNYELDPTIIRCLTGHTVPGISGKDIDKETGQLVSSDDPRVTAGQQGIEAGRKELRSALLSKVSRERFGIEVDKMIKGPNPLLALFLIHRLGLFSLIFHPPPSAGALLVEKSASNASPGHAASDSVALNAARLLEAILKQTPFDSNSAEAVAMDVLSIEGGQTDACKTKQVTKAFSDLPPSPVTSEILASLPESLTKAWSEVTLTTEEQRRLWVTVALLPLHGLVYEEKKKKFVWAGESVIANGLKLGTKTLKEPVASLIKSIHLLSTGRRVLLGSTEQMQNSANELEALLHLPPGLSTRSQLAMLLRNSNVSHSALHLRPESALLITFIAEAIVIWQASGRFDHNSDTLASCQNQIVALAHEYGQFWLTLEQRNLVARAEEKPLLDGNALSLALNCHPKLISTIQTFVLSWQFDRPPASTSEEQAGLEQECMSWLKAEWDKGGIVPPNQRPPPPPASKGGNGKKKGAATPVTASSNNDGDRRKRQKSE